MRDWFRWLFNGHNAQLRIDAHLLKLDDGVLGVHVQTARLKGQFDQMAADLSALRLRLSEIHESHDKQLSDLRAIVTNHEKEKPPQIRQARHMGEVRAVLALNEQNDEDAA